jgi:hypothetical protein
MSEPTGATPNPESAAPALPTATTADGADFLAGLPDIAPNPLEAATKPAATPETTAPDAAKPAEKSQPGETPKLNIRAQDEPVPDHIPDDAPMPRQSAEWKKFRNALNESRALLKDREAKLAEVSKLAESAKELDSIRQERDELAQRIKLAALEGDREITAPYDSEAALVRDLAKQELATDKVDGFESILKMPPGVFRKKALAEFTEDMTPIEASMIAQRVSDHDKIMAKRNKAVEEARGNYENIVKQRDAAAVAQKQAKQEAMQRAFERTMNDVRSQDGWRDLLAPENATPEHKAFAEKIVKAANQIFNGNVGDERELARASLHAVAAPVLMGELLSKEKELVALKKQLESMNAATPSASSTNRGTTISTNSSDDFLDGIHRLIGR